jgi:hypothetical protein
MLLPRFHRIVAKKLRPLEFEFSAASAAFLGGEALWSLKRDGFTLNRHHAFSFLFEHDLFGIML